MRSKWIAIGALWAALAIGLGAFGAHGLRERVGATELEWWHTGVLYQMVQAIGLILFGLLQERRACSGVAGTLLFVGSLIFSATLYGLTLGGPRWLGAITPFGGVGMIAGWCVFAWQAWRKA